VRPEETSRYPSLLRTVLTVVIGDRSTVRLLLLALVLVLAGILIALPTASSDAAHQSPRAGSSLVTSGTVTD